MSERSTTSSVNSKWWYWVALQPLAVLGLILVWIVTFAVVGVPTGSVLGGGASPLAVVAGLYTYAVVALHFIVPFTYFADTKAISNAKGCEWNPSGAAYAGLGLLFGSFVALWYLRNRRHYLDVP